MTNLDSNFPIIIEQPLSWGDMDAFQHINNIVYFRYFENVRMEYFSEANLDTHMESTQNGPILASTQCDFRAPLTYPDTIRIGATIDSVDARRFTMRYQVESESLGRIAAEGTGLIVWYDYQKGVSCEIPENIRQAIHKIQSRVSR